MRRAALAIAMLLPIAALACAPAPELAVGCDGCHGLDAGHGDAAVLHGQPEVRLLAALRGYRQAVDTPPTVMHRMLLGLDDAVLVALARHYSCAATP